MNIEKIIEKLPHGSGIDYDWQISENSKYIICENAYHYMDENGFYDGVLPFTLKIPKDRPIGFKLMFHVNGAGRYRIIKGGVRDYLEYAFAEFIHNNTKLMEV